MEALSSPKAFEDDDFFGMTMDSYTHFQARLLHRSSVPFVIVPKSARSQYFDAQVSRELNPSCWVKLGIKHACDLLNGIKHLALPGVRRPPSHETYLIGRTVRSGENERKGKLIPIRDHEGTIPNSYIFCNQTVSKIPPVLHTRAWSSIFFCNMGIGPVNEQAYRLQPSYRG